VIKAIETVYNGYRFRSRLEARWAVFFDTLGIEYKYEPEGFDLGDGIWYLPDFWLSKRECWVEIKGCVSNDEEKQKAYLLANNGYNVFILCGTPWVSWAPWDTWEDGEAKYAGMGFFGNHDKAVLEKIVGDYSLFLATGGGTRFDSLAEMLQEQDRTIFSSPVPSWDSTEKTIKLLIERDREYYQHKYGIEHPHWLWGHTQTGLLWAEIESSVMLDLPYNYGPVSHFVSERLENAYTAARQARFEKGR